MSDARPGPEAEASPSAVRPAASGSLAAIGALGAAPPLPDPSSGAGAFGRQGGPAARKQQPAKPVPLRPPLGMPQQQQPPPEGLLRVKQNPDEDADDASSSDSDEDGAHMVPQMGGPGGGMQMAAGAGGGMQAYAGQRKRGGDRSEEKERKRLKRLLRNRVSAQQARERKKAYLTDLEARSRELEQKNAELEERVSTLQRENFMLRQIVKNTTMKKSSQATPS